MARKRNTKKTEAQTADNQVIADDATVLDADADLAAIEAMLAEGGDLEIPVPSDEPAEEPAVETVASDSHDLVDEALAEIEAQASEAPEVVADEDTSEDDAVAALEAEKSREGAYADQSSEVDIVAAPKKAKTPRPPKQSFEEAIRAMHAAEPICLDAEEGPLDAAGIDALIADVPQKKVREKVLQTLNAVISGGNLSVYTKLALDLLKAAYLSGEPLTAEQIAKAYEEAGYKSGTVSAQKGQMLVMFSALGMAKRTGQTLHPNPNSVLLDALCS